MCLKDAHIRKKKLPEDDPLWVQDPEEKAWPLIISFICCALKALRGPATAADTAG